MNSSLKLGITGGIGAGKSTIARIFNIVGYPVYNADRRAAIITDSPDILFKIQSIFSEQIISEGRLDRKKVASLAFHDPEKLNQMNAIIHPAVAEDFQSWLSRQEAGIVFKEAALLFETGSYRDLDKTILVTADREIRIKRVLRRDTHRSRQQVVDIMDRQMPEEQKIERADYILVNDEQQPVLEAALNLLKQLEHLSQSH